MESEQLSVPPRYAGFWIRAVAEMIDSTVLTIVSWLLELVLLFVFYLGLSYWRLRQGDTVPPFFDAFNALWLQIFNAGLYLCIAFPYYVWGHFRWGTTLGKRIFRIYVVDVKSFEKITLRQSIIRFFSYGLSYAVFCTGFLMAAFHPEKRALHDLTAGTISIRRPRSV